MFEVSDLSFSYPDSFRLKVPNFTAKNGESHALVGASGCGKTTFLQLLAGILTPTEGRVELGGTPTTQTGFRLNHIGLIFQEFQLVPHLTVADNIRLCSLLGAKPEEEEISKLADETGLSSQLKRFPSDLSGGEQQRVAICRALANQPRLLLADEPTANLDPDNKHRVLQLLIRTAKDRNIPLIVSTHDHDLLPSFDHVHPFAALNQA